LDSKNGKQEKETETKQEEQEHKKVVETAARRSAKWTKMLKNWDKYFNKKKKKVCLQITNNKKKKKTGVYFFFIKRNQPNSLKIELEKEFHNQ